MAELCILKEDIPDLRFLPVCSRSRLSSNNSSVKDKEHLEYCFQKELTILGAQQHDGVASKAGKSTINPQRREKMKWGSNAKGTFSVK